jgi:hypothetical protein
MGSTSVPLLTGEPITRDILYLVNNYRLSDALNALGVTGKRNQNILQKAFGKIYAASSTRQFIVARKKLAAHIGKKVAPTRRKKSEKIQKLSNKPTAG